MSSKALKFSILRNQQEDSDDDNNESVISNDDDSKCNKPINVTVINQCPDQ
jgi:hypothetical protein